MLLNMVYGEWQLMGKGKTARKGESDGRTAIRLKKIGLTEMNEVTGRKSTGEHLCNQASCAHCWLLGP